MAVRLKDRIEANIRQSDKVNSSLSINGQSYNGSQDITVSTLGVEYGGTGATSFSSNYVLLGNGANAIKVADIHLNYKDGTTEANGYEELVIGNKIASGTAGNHFGRLALYSTSTGGAYITSAAGTSWPNHILPTTGGTILNTGTTTWTAADPATAKVGTLKLNGTNKVLYDVFLYQRGANFTDNSITDLNNVKVPSVYYSNNSTETGTLTNAPPGIASGFRLITLAGYQGTSDYGYQLAFSSERILWRKMGASNAAPSSWYGFIPFVEGTAIGSANQPFYLTAKGVPTDCNTFVPTTGGTFSGTVIFSKTQDADPAKDNGPALIVGGTRTTAHLELDNNEIICKATGTTIADFGLTANKITLTGPVTASSTIACGSTMTATGAIYTSSSYYTTRNPNSTCYIIFRRAANHTTESFVSGDYSYVLKANGAAELGQIYYNPSFAATRTKTADGTVEENYTSRGYFTFRCYSINSTTGARLSYYYRYYLYPVVPNDLTASKSFYIMTQTNSSISASTSKRYVVGITEANGAINYNASVYTSGSVLYGACWNDYAEYRAQNELLIAGHITYCDDDGKLKYTTERLQKFEGVVSDTFGFSIGETDECKTPLAVSGRVLVYCDPEDHFHSGDCVCAGPDGKAYRMTREEIAMYPDRIVGVVSEIPTYEHWGTGNVKVNGRIWIKVK